jgi:hypothetical protein
MPFQSDIGEPIVVHQAKDHIWVVVGYVDGEPLGVSGDSKDGTIKYWKKRYREELANAIPK